MEAFRHNAWATGRLLEFCGRLTPEQLQVTPAGTYGTILATLNHIISSDAGYLPKPKITRPDWAGGDDEISDFSALMARVDETAALWERYIADPLASDHNLSLDAGAYEAAAFVPIVQALHHGNAHREQVCAIVTALGFEPPDISVWAYAEAKGRAREVPAPTR